MLDNFINTFGFPGVAYIGGGGEPMLSCDYLSILRLFKLNSVTIVTITNGSCLDVLEDGDALGTNFIISIPSVDDDIFSDYTGVASKSILNSIKRNIKRIKDNAVVQVTLTKQTLKESNILGLFEFCEASGVSFINFQLASDSMNGDRDCYLNPVTDDWLDKIVQIGKPFKLNILGHSQINPDYYYAFRNQKNYYAESISLQEDGKILCCCSPGAQHIGFLSKNYRYGTIEEFKSMSSCCGKCREI